MGSSPRDCKLSVEFIPFLDTIKSLLPQAEDWSLLQRQLKSELFTKLHKRENLSSPLSPRENNPRSRGLYCCFSAINYAIQMLIKASLHALAWVIKLDTWGQMPLSPQKGEEDEKAAVLGQCHTKPMIGQKMLAVETVTLHNSRLLDLTFYSEIHFSVCIRSSDPPKPELATWKTLGVTNIHQFDCCHYLE